MSPSGDPAEQASALGEVPAVVQRYLVFHAIMTAFGFPPEAIGHVLTGSELAATIEVEGRGFSYVLGPTIPHVASWLRHAAELWCAAEPAAREALFEGSPLFEHTRFPELIRTMTRAGLRPPIPIGLWYSRLESSGIGAAVRRLATFPAATPSTNAAPRSRAAPTAPERVIGPQRFPLGELAYMNDDGVPLSAVELTPLLGRHASGDWGESLHGPDNDAALQTGRAVMSAFRTTDGQRLWLITWASRTRTVVWPQIGPDFPEEALLDLACRYVGTGRGADMRANPQESMFHLPLVGDLAPNHPHHAQKMETAALLLGAVITQDGESVIPTGRSSSCARCGAPSMALISVRSIGRVGTLGTMRASATGPRPSNGARICNRCLVRRELGGLVGVARPRRRSSIGETIRTISFLASVNLGLRWRSDLMYRSGPPSSQVK